MELILICLHKQCNFITIYIINFTNLILSQDINPNNTSSISNIIGALQIYSRAFYLGLIPLDSSNIYKEIKILQIVNELTDSYYKQLNTLYQNILLNLLINFKLYFKSINNTNMLSNIQILQAKLKDQSYLGYIDKDNHTLAHWLIFYNKINNDVHIYQLTKKEDELKFLWKDKLESHNYLSVDLSDINFLFKYEVLKNDVMYRSVSRGDDC